VAGRGEEGGAEVVSPYAGYSVIIRATAKVAGAVSQLKSVRWVGTCPTPRGCRAHRQRSSAPVDKAPSDPRTRLLHGAYSVQFFNPSARRKPARRWAAGFQITEDLSSAACSK